MTDLFTLADSAAQLVLAQTPLRPKIGLVLGSGLGGLVARRLGLVEDLLQRLPVQLELTLDATLALAFHQHAVADLGPLVHVGVHPRPSLGLP